MTQTFTTDVSYRLVSPGLSTMMLLLGTILIGSFVWLRRAHPCRVLNLGHWSLFEVWFLKLGIFLIFTMHVNLISYRSGFITPNTDNESPEWKSYSMPPSSRSDMSIHPVILSLQPVFSISYGARGTRWLKQVHFDVAGFTGNPGYGWN